MAIKSWHVGIAAEAFAAGMFARCGCDVMVQYGANQPEYDLAVSQGSSLMKVSVKGSQDGSWGLTQNYKKGRSYHEAIDDWEHGHSKKTVFCLVQFENVPEDGLPRCYLALPSEIANHMKNERAGMGETILHESHEWKGGVAAGTKDEIPQNWKFSNVRIQEMFALTK